MYYSLCLLHKPWLQVEKKKDKLKAFMTHQDSLCDQLAKLAQSKSIIKRERERERDRGNDISPK